MKKAETNRFNDLYQSHLRSLKLQGKSQKTIDAYARAVRRISKRFYCCPDQLTLEQREQYLPHRVVVWVATRYGIVAKLRQEVFLDVPELVSRRPTERP